MDYKITDEDSGKTFETDDFKLVEEMIYGKDKFPTFVLILIAVVVITILVLLLLFA